MNVEQFEGLLRELATCKGGRVCPMCEAKIGHLVAEYRGALQARNALAADAERLHDVEKRVALWDTGSGK